MNQGLWPSPVGGSSRAALLLWALLLGLLPTASAGPADADPPRTLALDLAAPAGQWLPQVLPMGARVLHGPVALPFGAHGSGQLLASRVRQIFA
jgi:hypothetical protein